MNVALNAGPIASQSRAPRSTTPETETGASRRPFRPGVSSTLYFFGVKIAVR